MGNFPNADASVLPHGDKNLSPRAQVKRLQRVCYDRAMLPDTDNREIAQLALAWERLEERKRVMVGKPAPKPQDMGYKTGKKGKFKVAMTSELLPAPDPGPADSPAAS